ncbi:MAG: class I SAM-dependent methyltransferase [Actinomycetota bacterium]|nr:class I SAM-dependent methyltransferase [Actinomycetota bacterium]
MRHPQRWDRALDFGCGVGRLVPALSGAFDHYVGADISESMVTQARALHASSSNCSFVTVADTDERLRRWPDRSFDLVYSFHVLQHLDSPPTIVAYLASLLRLLAPGGLWVVQLPAHMPRAERRAYDTRRALYAGLAQAGVPPAFLYRRLGLFPMTMNFLPEAQVMALVRRAGGRVLEVDRARVGIAIRDRTYYVTRDR